MTLLTTLLVDNDEALETFTKMDGLNQLLTILEGKVASLNENSTQTMFNLLTSIVCNDLKAISNIKVLQDLKAGPSCAS